MKRRLLLALCMVLTVTVLRAQSWTALTNLAPDINGGVMLLLPDGTVMCKTFTGGVRGKKWNKLTPDVHGSYVNGTWSSTDTMHDDRLYFSSQVLKDGRVYVAGGEYGTGKPKAEVYDPLANTWTMTPSVAAGDSFSDANSEILPDGHVLQAIVRGRTQNNYNYNPATNTYADAPMSVGLHWEVAWVKLPDCSILSPELFSPTGDYVSSERFIPNSGWVADGEIPDTLFSVYGWETGPGFLLPDGRAIFFGGTGHTAYYTPSGNSSPGTWTAGPDIPGGQGMPDAAGAMMVNGKILIAVSPSPTSDIIYHTPTAFYVFDYTDNSFTPVNAPGGGTSINMQSFMTNMLCLPDGTILYASQYDQQYYVFNPGGTPLTAGKPAVNTVYSNTTTSFTITGTLFNGITEGAGYGDDWQMASNYPLVRLTSGTNVYYCRTSNWNSTGVMRGSALDTATFTLPAGLPAGTYSLQVTANGNASSNYVFPVPWPEHVSPSAHIVCAGSTFAFSDATTGGTWSSSNTSTATVDGSGVVTGVSAGTAKITYALSDGGYSTAMVTVNPAPLAGAITGAVSVCVGYTTQLSDAVSGGSWSSGNTSVATVNSSGLVTGMAAGNAAISYVVNSACGDSYAYVVQFIDVDRVPYSIDGVNTLCVTSSATLSDYTPGGTWSSSDPGKVSVSSIGIITAGSGTGTARISYSTGCSTTSLIVTVIATSAGTISGPTNVDVGSIITLTDAAGGGAGTWVADNSNVTVSSAGVVTGVTAGIVTIHYYVTGVCGTVDATYLITVNSSCPILPATPTVCVGGTVTLTDAGTDGTWSSSNTDVAAIASTGIVTGVSTGTAVISYVLPGGCYGITVVIVTGAPDAGTINGPTAVCGNGNIIHLSDDVTGGSWSSSNTSIARVGSTGIVTGESAGEALISYTKTGSCGIAWAFTFIMVNALPTVTVNPTSANICAGGNTLLSTSAGSSRIMLEDFNSGFGAWTRDNSGTTNTSGVATWRVEPNGFNDMYGAWYSPDLTAYAEVNGYGIHPADVSDSRLISPVFSLAGATSATLTFQHTYFASDYDNNVEVDVSTDGGTNWALLQDYKGASRGDPTHYQPASIDLSAYAGQSYLKVRFYYNTYYYGYYWALDNVQIAASGSSELAVWTPASTLYKDAGLTIPYDGTPTGQVYAAPAATTTYYAFVTSTNGCTGSAYPSTVSVNAAPVAGAITGTTTLCSGSTTHLTDATGGGTWSSSNTGTATVGATGIVTGVSAGTTRITYTVANSCGTADTTIVVTVNSTTPISGTSPICLGISVSFSDATPGGSWTSSNTSVASVGSTGLVTCPGTGTAVISYTTSCGTATYPVTVIATSAGTISGAAVVTVGSNITLSDAVAGGSWSASNGNATVSGGLVTGVSAGSVTIYYAVTGACGTVVATKLITVNNSTIAAITGSTSVCAGSTTTLSDATTGGTWISSNNTIATVGSSSGVVTGVAAGTVHITYTAGGVSTSVLFTVLASPLPVNGTSLVCVGTTITLSDAIGGGTWSSTNSSIASIGSTGVVNGVSPGSVTISYSLSSGCVSIKSITANAVPTVILGGTSLCLGGTATLTDATGGGVWTSSNTSVATIGSATGLLTGTGTATATITYTAGGCYTTAVVTVSGTPSAILGTKVVCAGSATSLSDGTAGGSWSTVAGSGSVSFTGTSAVTVTGVTAGTATMSYTMTTGCSAITVVTVNAGSTPIGGNAPVCIGSSVTLTDGTAGGTWTSANTATATVGSGTGIVTGVAAGVVVITYSTGGSCYATANVTVNASISAITGPSTVCQGLTIALSDATAGGAWSSSNPAVGTVSATGVVSGLGAGTTNITYTVGGCNRVVTITVNTAPSAINGTLSICGGTTTTLTDATAGGIWSLSSSLIATIGSATGLVTASSTYTGTTTVSYTLGGCPAIAVLTVSSRPAPIQGATSECVGVTITLSDATTGGAWSSSNAYVSFGSTGGSPVSVTGITAGAGTITYSLGAGCYVTIANTVYANPGPISGIFAVCTGLTTTLSDATAGGAWTSSAPAVASASGYTITGVTAGTAIITYKITAGNCIATQAVTVNASPVVTAISGPTSISHATPATLSDATAGGVWTSNHIAVISLSGSTGSPVTATAVATSGTATISYAVTNTGCTTTVTKNISAVPAPPPHTTGVTTADLFKEVILYPNPTNGSINIRSDVGGVFYLYSMDGKALGQYKINDGITNMTLPGELATGIYMGKYVGDDGSTIQFKIVKQ